MPVGDDQVSMLLYADDIVLLSESPYGLQQQLNIVNTWMANWYMTVNLDKSKVLHFRPKRTPKTIAKFYIGISRLEVTDMYRYLGITFTDTVDYKITADLLAKASSRATSKVISLYYANKGLSWNVYSHIYNNLVGPVMDYASAVWGFRRYGACDNVQRRAIRCFLGVGKKTPIPAMESDMGWYPPFVRHKVDIVRLWCRLCLMPEHRLVRRIFNWDCELANNGVDTWAKDAGSVLQECGLLSLHSTRLLTSSIKWITDTVLQKSANNFTEQWTHDVAAMPKLHTFSQLAPTFQTAHYAKTLPRNLRTTIARMRAGVLPLAIETGRWRGQPVEQRRCPVCPGQIVEDEFHFLCECPCYDPLRRQYLTPITGPNWPNQSRPEQLRELFCDQMVYNTSKFISESYRKRSISFL